MLVPYPQHCSRPRSYLTVLISNSFPHVIHTVVCCLCSCPLYSSPLNWKKVKTLAIISLLPRAHKKQSLKSLRTPSSLCDIYWVSNPSAILGSYLEPSGAAVHTRQLSLGTGLLVVSRAGHYQDSPKPASPLLLGIQRAECRSFLTAVEVKNTSGQLVNRMTRIRLEWGE